MGGNWNPHIMKTLKRMTAALLMLAAFGTGTSCMTTYDAYGRPVQSVDPGVAVAGAVAAGIVGMAIADDHHHRPRYHCY